MICSEEEADQALVELTRIIHQLVEKPNKKYRCEDLISAAAAFVGEACLRRAAEFEVDCHEFDPGDPVFSRGINVALCGDRTEWPDIPKASAYGRAFHVLTTDPDAPWPVASFPDVADIFRRYARARREGVPGDARGKTVLGIPEKNLPTQAPLNIAYEIREKVVDTFPEHLLGVDVVGLIAEMTLLKILMIVRPHIDPRIALSLALGTMNATAKTAPLLSMHVAEWQRSQARRA
jgi:hypothetical protein